ncbi:MAG: alpha/beta hydrolase [Rhodobacteraceae bacterium]|nr:alpha/beta hydrolase [Paracoccaceae bacterium]
MSRRLALVNRGLKLLVKPRLRRATDVAAARQSFERAAKVFLRGPSHMMSRDPENPQLTWIRTGPVAPRRLVFYVHGGAYVFGSPCTHRGLLAQLSRCSGIEVCTPAYRLAPEHPAPAAFEDVLAAFHSVLNRGYRPEHIILAGDSAGAGAALAVLARLCDEGLRPRGLVAFSPWTDLDMTGVSLRTNALVDPVLPSDRMDEIVGMILQGVSPRDPRVSPLYARFDAPPPVLLQYSQTEILRDDSVRIGARLQEQGGRVILQQHERAPHAWPLFDGWFPEARASIRAAAEFIQDCFDDTKR